MATFPSKVWRCSRGGFPFALYNQKIRGSINHQCQQPTNQPTNQPTKPTNHPTSQPASQPANKPTKGCHQFRSWGPEKQRQEPFLARGPPERFPTNPGPFPGVSSRRASSAEAPEPQSKPIGAKMVVIPEPRTGLSCSDFRKLLVVGDPSLTDLHLPESVLIVAHLGKGCHCERFQRTVKKPN